MDMPDSMVAPLSGITVIEICNVAAGPFCGMLLADMGADVIKIEHPEGGDTLRSWPPISNGYSENFASLNRNKRSVTLNLKDPGEVELARRLIADADVLLENNRPGVMDRLGLGYAALRERNPRLLYCSISAYGQSGPRAQEGGFDLTIQAMSGIMSVTGEQGGAPVKCGVPLADFSAGLYGAFSIASALREVQSTGQGAHIDVAMLGTTLGIAALQTSEFFGSGRDPVKLGSAHPRNAPYQAFRCRDGYFGMAAGNNALWKSVCAVVGREAWYADPRFADTSLRARNQDALRESLEDIFMQQDAEYWLDRFRAAGVPCAPINSYSQVLDDPQVAHMGWVQPVQLPNGVQTRTFGMPVRFDGRASAIRQRPPALGEHNDDILAPLRDALPASETAK
jgi:crotonobetainyl-CoA:carnitine CoA-transferase CaiB-like acyl-CoA transferase